MVTIEKKSFDSPVDIMKPTENVKVEVITVGGFTFKELQYNPDGSGQNISNPLRGLRAVKYPTFCM